MINVKKHIEEVYLSNDVAALVNSLKPDYLRKDIKQHCFLELLEKGEEFLKDLIERGKLKHYIVKTIYNTARWERSSFQKALGKETPTETFEDLEEELCEEISIDLSKLHWYKAELLKMYSGVKTCNCGNLMKAEEENCLKCGKTNPDPKKYCTYQSISEVTLIPVTSVYKTIKETQKELQK